MSYFSYVLVKNPSLPVFFFFFLHVVHETNIPVKAYIWSKMLHYCCNIYSLKNIGITCNLLQSSSNETFFFASVMVSSCVE